MDDLRLLLGDKQALETASTVAEIQVGVFGFLFCAQSRDVLKKIISFLGSITELTVLLRQYMHAFKGTILL